MLQMPKEGPVIIFDFDGTLADSFSVAIELLSELTHYKQATDEDISRLRGLDPLPLLRELRIPLWRVPVVAWRARREFGKRIDQVELIPGVAAAINELAARHRLFVLSSNSVANVRSVLRRFGIDRQFQGIYSNSRPLHKEQSLRRLMHVNKLSAASCWYVGDEARDVEAAHHVGLKAAAVSWGYNNIGALARHKPEVMVFTPEELVTYFAKESTHA